MKIIYKQRGKGKTTQLLYSSDTTRIPILVGDEHQKKYIVDDAIQLGLNIPQPLSVNDVVNKRGSVLPETCYVDNAEMVLSRLLNINVATLSLSDVEEKVTYKHHA